jgi:hypothetical protein
MNPVRSKVLPNEIRFYEAKLNFNNSQELMGQSEKLKYP